MSTDKQRVPTIMYHSIGIPDKSWNWNYLTCPVDIFESHLKWLKLFGFNTINFQEMYDYIVLDKPIPKKSVFLNFDDGYLDNYVFAYPLLKKYGMKGSVFVNSDFVDKSNKLRRNFDELERNESVNNLEYGGFCNWKELKKMDSEGVIDVQCHSKTHTWYPISDKIVDFRFPGDNYIWMDWNSHPDEKSNMQKSLRDNTEIGRAVFENEKALSSKRVFINESFQEKLMQHVKLNGGVDFFKRYTWKEELFKIAEDLKGEINPIISEETDNDYYKRIEYELNHCKKQIESNLLKEVNFLCWPGGSGTKVGGEIATKLGFLMSTAARDLSPEVRKKLINSSVFKINRIGRYAPVLYHNPNTSNIRYYSGLFFVLNAFAYKIPLFENLCVKYLRYFLVKVNKMYG